MRREYCYIGSQEIVDNLPKKSARVCVRSQQDAVNWIKNTNQVTDYNGYIATFIIDTQNQLWINERRSEHVLCAAGENVLSAGEITFSIDDDCVEVVDVTNQSTGYCPEPESWDAVKLALNNAQIPHPNNFTMKCIFRLCEKCDTKNLVKDNWFICGVCDAELSQNWNFD